MVTTPKKRTLEYSFDAGTSNHPTENGMLDDDDRTDTDDDEDHQAAPIQSTEEFLKEAYNNLLLGNWDPSFVTTDYHEINGDYEDVNHQNLLKSF